jgi:hypothetical protein
MATSRWFSEPGALAPLPEELMASGAQAPLSSFGAQPVPSPLAPEPAVARPKKAKRQQVANGEDAGLPDRAAGLLEPLGRCRALVAGKRCAVPYALAHLDASQADEDAELLAVELRAPGGEDGWLDDRTLTGVLHPDSDTVYSLSALRRLVQARVALGGAGSRSRNLRRALYNVCEPDCRSRLLVTVVALTDLQALPLVSGEDPPATSSG